MPRHTKEETRRLEKLVLNTALRITLEKSLYGLTMQEVCARSGQSNNFLYHHFGNLEGLRWRVAAQLADLAEIRLLQPTEGGPPLVSEILHRARRISLRDTDRSRLPVMICTLKDGSESSHLYRHLVHMLTERYTPQQLAEAGCTPEDLGYLAWCSVLGLCFLSAEHGELCQLTDEQQEIGLRARLTAFDVWLKEGKGQLYEPRNNLDEVRALLHRPLTENESAGTLQQARLRNAVGRLVQKKPFWEVTTADILDVAGMGTSSLYCQYEGKRVLFSEMAAQMWGKLQTRAASALSRGRNALDSLEEMVLCALHWMRETKNYAGVLLSVEVLRNPHTHRRLRDILRGCNGGMALGATVENVPAWMNDALDSASFVMLCGLAVCAACDADFDAHHNLSDMTRLYLRMVQAYAWREQAHI